MKKRGRTLIAVVLCAVLALGVLTGCTTQTSMTQSQYTDYTVTIGEIKNTLSLEGYLIPKQTVNITAEDNSKVAKIIKKKGYSVAKGGDILLLENGNTVKAPVKGTITKLNVAVGDWVDSTVTIGTMSDTGSKPYQSAVLTGAVSSHVSKVNVKEGDTVTEGDALVELESGNAVKAPFAGTISAVSVEVGDKVNSATQIASIVDTSNYYIEVSVNEIETQQLKIGQSVNVTINALDLPTTGKVSDISVEGTVSNSTTNFTVKIQLDEQNPGFRTNMSAQVNILVAEVSDALAVPIDAVLTLNGRKIVMKKSGTAYTAQEVETGISNSSYVQITSGLAAGDIVGVENTGTFNGTGLIMNGFPGNTSPRQSPAEGWQPRSRD
ncbi:MAG: HlyD family efflux transporter periplasmic adaptor subunit [Bacillota bacterium]|nr:HlyD family efflux transporter periplasmic adaptor subunit [Bacillota bacterium]